MRVFKEDTGFTDLLQLSEPSQLKGYLFDILLVAGFGFVFGMGLMMHDRPEPAESSRQQALVGPSAPVAQKPRLTRAPARPKRAVLPKARI